MFERDSGDGTAFLYFSLVSLALVMVPTGWIAIDSLMLQFGLKKPPQARQGRTMLEQSKLQAARTQKKLWTGGRIAAVVVFVACFIGFIFCAVAVALAAPLEQWNPFDVLELEADATARQIKKAFRTLSLKYHPDRPTGDEVRFLDVTRAYKTLTDETMAENWRKYGNPDGPQSLKVSVGLPAWMTNKDNMVLVLGLYVVVLVLAIPSGLYFMSRPAKRMAQLAQSSLIWMNRVLSHRLPGPALLAVFGGLAEFALLPWQDEDERVIAEVHPAVSRILAPKARPEQVPLALGYLPYFQRPDTKLSVESGYTVDVKVGHRNAMLLWLHMMRQMPEQWPADQRDRLNGITREMLSHLGKYIRPFVELMSSPRKITAVDPVWFSRWESLLDQHKAGKDVVSTHAAPEQDDAGQKKPQAAAGRGGPRRSGAAARQRKKRGKKAAAKKKAKEGPVSKELAERRRMRKERRLRESCQSPRCLFDGIQQFQCLFQALMPIQNPYAQLFDVMTMSDGVKRLPPSVPLAKLLQEPDEQKRNQVLTDFFTGDLAGVPADKRVERVQAGEAATLAAQPLLQTLPNVELHWSIKMAAEPMVPWTKYQDIDPEDGSPLKLEPQQMLELSIRLAHLELGQDRSDLEKVFGPVGDLSDPTGSKARGKASAGAGAEAAAPEEEEEVEASDEEEDEEEEEEIDPRAVFQNMLKDPEEDEAVAKEHEHDLKFDEEVPPVHCPVFTAAEEVTEQWVVMMVSEEEFIREKKDLLFITPPQIILARTRVEELKMTVFVPPVPGKYRYVLRAFCLNYRGLDKSYPIDIEVHPDPAEALRVRLDVATGNHVGEDDMADNPLAEGATQTLEQAVSRFVNDGREVDDDSDEEYTDEEEDDDGSDGEDGDDSGDEAD